MVWSGVRSCSSLSAASFSAWSLLNEEETSEGIRIVNLDQQTSIVSVPANRSLNLFNCCLNASTSVPLLSPSAPLVRDIVALVGSVSVSGSVWGGSAVAVGETSPSPALSTMAG